MKLKDLAFLLAYIEETKESLMAWEAVFADSRKMGAYSDEDIARIHGTYRGEVFRLRELEAVDINVQRSADVWLSPPAWAEAALKALQRTKEDE